jgi:hypothetical protein
VDTGVTSLDFCADGDEPMLLATGAATVIYHLGRREVARRLAGVFGHAGPLVRTGIAGGRR